MIKWIETKKKRPPVWDQRTHDGQFANILYAIRNEYAPTGYEMCAGIFRNIDGDFRFCADRKDYEGCSIEEVPFWAELNPPV